MNIRRDIWSLESVDVWEPVTLAYARAVDEMQSRSPDDPTSWHFQAAIHGTNEGDRPGWNQCQHASWFFLPWHRMYIFQFEQIVRSIVLEQGGPEDWGLPYWNYSKGFPSNTLPPAFREPQLPDGVPNPLFVPEPDRNAAGINRGAQLPPQTVEIDTALAEPLFTPPPAPGFGGSVSPPAHFAPRQFTGALENAPHNVVHGLVGGTGLMGDPNRAAQDPIFWLHHSNIDRVWAKWRTAGGEDPTDPRWLDQTYPLFDSGGQPVNMAVSEVIDPDREEQLGYRYDDEPPARALRVRAARTAGVTGPGEGAGQMRSLTASEGIVLGGESTTIRLPLRGAERGIVAAADAPGALSLTVEDVEVDEDTGGVYAVYLGEHAGPDNLVGYITFFGAEHHAGHGGINHAYDVTGVVARLREKGQWTGDDPQVTFVPVGVSPPPGEEGKSEQPPTRARIGRVSLAAAGPGPQETPPGGGGETPGDGEILAWEDDPGAPPSSLAPVPRPVPDLGGERLAIAITDPRPAGGAAPGSPEFRYWAAAEALARGRELWSRLLPDDLGAWMTGTQLEVTLDDPAPELNAYYSRDDGGLFFYHDDVRGQTVWSAESPDVVCHELGHAVLDALRPQLWDATATEPAAFHESFGDISALLCALEVPELREAALSETGGKPWRSSRASRVAEQLGWAIRATTPQGAEPTCLRDAANSWFYSDPATLPPGGPASVMSTEPHWFARIFTGAALKAIAGMFELQPNKDADGLHQAAIDFGRLLVAAVQRAPIVPGYYSQVAAHMIEADQIEGRRYQEALRFGFVRHGVLALPSAQAITPPPRGIAAMGGVQRAASGELPRMQLPNDVGLESLVVRAAGQQKRLGVAGAALDTGAAPAHGSETAAQIFVEDLFRQGRVDAEVAADQGVLLAPLAYKTHVLQQVEDGVFLHRRSFDCGLHPLDMGG